MRRFSPAIYVQSNRHRQPARRFEHLHDARMVRPYRVQIQIRTFRHHRCRPVELGHRAVRILFPGTGQPHRIDAVRGPVLALGAESNSGGGIAFGLRAFRAGLHEIGHPALEPPRGIHVPDSGRLFHLPEIASPLPSITP